MKKISTHFPLHTVEETEAFPHGDGYSSDEDNNKMKENIHEPEALLDKLEVKVPDRVMNRLFLRIRISSVRNRN
jgi:exonuclease I